MQRKKPDWLLRRSFDGSGSGQVAVGFMMIVGRNEAFALSFFGQFFLELWTFGFCVESVE